MYKFGSALEKESPRFTGPGDFFTYVVFVGTFLLVSTGSSNPNRIFQIDFSLSFPSNVKSVYLVDWRNHLAFLPAQPHLAEAVPGERGRLPLHPVQSLSANLGLYAVWVWWDTSIACVIFISRAVVTVPYIINTVFIFM